MKLYKYLVLLAVAAASFIVAGCIKDPELQPAEIGVNVETTDFTADGGSATVKLFSNRDWKAEIVGSDSQETTWLTVSESAGTAMTDSLSITITVLPNTGAGRQATINFRTETIYASVRVSQKGAGGDDPIGGDEGEFSLIGDYAKWNAIAPVTSFSDDFSTITEAYKPYVNDNWLFYTTDGTDINYAWKTRTYNQDKYIDIAPYASTASSVVAYALIPKVNINAAAEKNIKFKLALYYQTQDDSKLEVVYSENFTGNFTSATWTLIKDVSFAEGAKTNEWNEIGIDLSSLSEKTSLSIAFRYTGKANTYRLDDVQFAGGALPGGGGEEGGGDDYSLIGDYTKWNAIVPVSSFADNFSSVTEAYKPYTNDNWLFYTSDGTDINYAWKTRTYNEDKYLDIAPYGSSAASVTAFALMPKVNVSTAAVKNLKFKLALYYKEADASKLEVVTSKDFSGDFAGATWTVLQDVSFAADAALNTWVEKVVDLTSLAAETSLCIAFRYTGKANTYRLDDVQFAEGTFPDPGEGGGDNPGGGEGGGAGDGVYTSNVDITSNISAGKNCYAYKVNTAGASYDGLKIGKSKEEGSYTTTALPLTGDMTLTFYAVAWNNASCNLTVTINNGGTIDSGASKTYSLTANPGTASTTSEGTLTFGNTDFYTVSLSGVTSSSTITFATASAGPRAVMVGVNVKAASN